MNLFIADLTAIANTFNSYSYYVARIWSIQCAELISCNDLTGPRVYKVTTQLEGNYDISFFVLTADECIKIHSLEYLKEYLKEYL